MTLDTATSILLETAREVGNIHNEGSARGAGYVIAAAYRLAAIKLHEQGNHLPAQELERVADEAATRERLTYGIPRETPPLVHFTRVPFIGLCTANEPNQRTSEIIESCTCPACLHLYNKIYNSARQL